MRVAAEPNRKINERLKRGEATAEHRRRQKNLRREEGGEDAGEIFLRAPVSAAARLVQVRERRERGMGAGAKPKRTGDEWPDAFGCSREQAKGAKART